MSRASKTEVVTGAVASVAFEKLAHAASELGVSLDMPAPLPTNANDPMTRVPLEALVGAWETLMRHSQRPDLPITLSAEFTAADFEIVGFIAGASRTLGDALSVLTEHIGHWIRGIAWEISGEETTCLRYRFAASRRRLGVRCVTETAITQLVQVARLLTGQSLTPIMVRFSHPAPKDAAAHRTFFGCPVVFDSVDDVVVVERSLLDTEIPSAQPGLRAFLEAQARLRRTEDPPRMTVASRVRQLLEARDDLARLGAPEIASRLHWSERSLRRRLDAEGTSLRTLIDESLERQACALLRAGTSVDDVAAQLGFAGRSAFARAFRRWTGKSPREFRAQT